ncbi:hypothetical protein G8J22_02465 [Lentilactobacillus hilgardii]|uniref:hypothetical protein n=1 Tax=Lentilactobacillus hilgardii TaxID=1588 RepID=UPI00019C47A1|nr:hypothetical protein [Lentilactobacillus hilgardii]EEI19701.1 hypothetical protein HMPREF0497_1538 [Lentilactobacillus buchneri ATCC 11577]MCT3397548.1 hypothetical protein [Lentilactobacillus hilgardii]QIR10457.1 hypothetical protein G8J22_02465 [Lentilactobacillus hilgardii]
MTGEFKTIILAGIAVLLLVLLPFLGGSNVFNRKNVEEPGLEVFRRAVFMSWIFLMISLGVGSAKVLLGFGSFSKNTIPSYFIQALIYYAIGYVLSRFDRKYSNHLQ